MKIKELESMLGITKANIRFYEKQGLLSPRRTENGYRDYSEEDVQRLKNIIILRKLNVSIPQIEEILDGELPLQEAVEQNITALQQEIKRLNGSLTLCRQLQQEGADTLDTGRYWQLIQEKEKKGFHFPSIARDYLAFAAPVFEALYWFPRQEAFYRPELFPKYLKYILLYFLAVAGVSAVVTGNGFLFEFFRLVKRYSTGILLLTVILIPIFLYRRQNKKKAEAIRDWVPFFMVVSAFVLTALALTVFVASLV